MKICIEAQLLNHHQRSGLMTYAEGLINSLKRNDSYNEYKLVYYSLTRTASDMPGPEGGNFQKIVLRIPDRNFFARQYAIDNIFLPSSLKRQEIKIFHRPSGDTIPHSDGVFNILTVHDLRTLAIGDQYLKQNIGRYKMTLSKVDICVVVSECTKRDLLQYFHLDEKKIRVNYLAADERFHPAEASKIAEVCSKHNINEPYFFSVGSVPRKNIDGIIRGFAGSQHKSNFLLVLGCKLNVDKYLALSEKLEIKNRVIFISNMNDQELVALYSGCHCFLFPSLYEGFGLPIIEAMRCGAPVITSNISSCPEIAGAAAFLVNPHNIGDISYAINQICKNSSDRQFLIKKGFERAKLFSWDKFAEGMKAIYSLA